MIPTKLRLTASEVKDVLKRGYSKSSEFFIIRYSENIDKKKSGFAVVTSSKFSQKATERNLIRRRVYEAIRLKNTDDIKYKMVFIPKKNILKTDYKNIEADISNIFTQLKQNG